ncbi:hypothetical protein [Acetobacter sp.]|uniref:hypothetical protein n=1 Tax=Acetobacter sp. TaxID=440 RepID=UPI0039EA3C73
MKRMLCGMMVITGMVAVSSPTMAQTYYTGRAITSGSRTDNYRRSSMPKPPSGLSGMGAGTEPRATSPLFPRTSSGRTTPYQSPLTERRAPETPALPHTAKPVLPQSYKSEMVGKSQKR